MKIKEPAHLQKHFLIIVKLKIKIVFKENFLFISSACIALAS